MKKLAVVLVPLAVAFAQACSLRTLAINSLGSAIASGGTTFSSDEDPELVGAALPFSLKLMESLLAESPRHRELLTAAARGFTQYTYGWVDSSADDEAGIAARLRAKRMYLRARNYGLRALDASIDGFARDFAADPQKAVARAAVRDVPALYWTAAPWALAISCAKDDVELMADLRAVDALIHRAAELDPDYDSGAIQTFLIAYESAQSATSGGAAERARAHFDRAVALSHGASASPYVAAAEALAVAAQDRAEFENLLERALAISPNARPEWQLQNVLAQRRARWLLDHADDLFIEAKKENDR